METITPVAQLLHGVFYFINKGENYVEYTIQKTIGTDTSTVRN